MTKGYTMSDETKDPISNLFYKAVGTLLGIGIGIGVVLSIIIGFVVWMFI